VLSTNVIGAEDIAWSIAGFALIASFLVSGGLLTK
jgi:hypothetical protein